MAQQTRIRWAQLRVGVMAIASLGLLGYLVFLLSGSQGFFRSKAEVYTYVGDSGDLADGAPVRLNGIDIGKVKDVRLSGSTDPRRVVKIVMEVYEDYFPSIPIDSGAKVATSNLLSPRYMAINKGTSKDTIKAGAELHSSSTAAMEDLFQQGDSTLSALEAVVKKIDKIADQVSSGQGTIGKFLVDPTLYDKAVALVAEAQRLVGVLNTDKGSLGAFINDRDLYDGLQGTVARINTLMDGLQQGQGTAGKFLKDPALYNDLQASIADLRKTVAQANQLIADLNAGKGTVGKLLKDDDLANQLHETFVRLDTTLDKVNSGQGTIGQLMNNPSLYESVDGTTRELHSLLKDFRANPKKFLTIKLVLF
jgi:phospholipid/cholesterol/gamma-HCH transport system substrate-binding protein